VLLVVLAEPLRSPGSCCADTATTTTTTESA
jgi:hypothetical protein